MESPNEDKQSWQKMNTQVNEGVAGSRAWRMFSEKLSDAMSSSRMGVDMQIDELAKVLWLSATLFFIVGGYWLLRSLKDPIMSAIDGVEYIPQAKIASLVVVFILVIVYNKLLDIFPKHQLFYLMGITYGVLFAVMGLLLLHPTIGLADTVANPYRPLGWISYVTIESFGSMVVQCFWALVNSSVDTKFAKKNFGYIVAGAQIGSILGPTLATQAEYVGIVSLYLLGSAVMFMMVTAMYFYVDKFGVPLKSDADSKDESKKKKSGKSEEGVLEGFYLFYEHDYVKGIFAVSSLYMVQVTVIDYMMKVLAKERYAAMYPDDPQAAMRAFASFMGYFGQTTNSISFLFSFFGTGFVIKRFGLTNTLISFPVLMVVCTLLVWLQPTIWMVFAVMMVIKGMSYALNNPTKEILYQTTSENIKFKCKSWIDTFGQRSSKALGSVITNSFASSIVDLTNYGSLLGVIIAAFLVWVSSYMGREFEALSASGEKVGEASAVLTAQLAALREQQRRQQQLSEEEEEKGDREDASLKTGDIDIDLAIADSSCSVEEEGQSQLDHKIYAKV